MQRLQMILSRPWTASLPESQQKLLHLSVSLWGEVDQTSEKVDYSYVVFPAAKAYEGYLKFYLFQHGLINREVFEGTHFRIGRAMNPDVRSYQRDQYWLYDDVKKACGEEMAKELWVAWLECRNHLFHYFVKRDLFITKEQAYQKLELLLTTMEKSWNCMQMRAAGNQPTWEKPYVSTT